MSDSQIEKDLREYLEKESNLRREDRLKYLMAIFDKHFTFNKLDHLATRHDIFQVISMAKSVYASFSLPMYISQKKMDNSELTPVAIIESFTNYLNKHNLLKKLVKIDYTDNSGEFEEIDWNKEI